MSASGNASLPAAIADFGLGQVRSEITTRDMDGLDGALGHLLQLLQQPANLAALAAQGHSPTDENVKVGNALWEYTSWMC